jgi:hypothetical protein
MAYSLYDAAVTPCVQQLGALAGIIDKAAAHCAANKIEESALLQDRLYPDMFCLARQIRESADFAMNTGGRLAGVTPPTMPAVDDTSFAAAKILLQKSPRGICKIETRNNRTGTNGSSLDQRCACAPDFECCSPRCAKSFCNSICHKPTLRRDLTNASRMTLPESLNSPLVPPAA